MALFSGTHDGCAGAYLRAKISLAIRRAWNEPFDDCRNPNTSYQSVTRILPAMNASPRHISFHSSVSSLRLAIRFSSVLAFVGVLLCSSMSAETALAGGAGSAVRGNRPAEGRQATVPLPLVFEENRGQAGAAARFLAHGPEGILVFTRDQVVLPCDSGAKGVSMTIEGGDTMQVRAEEPTGGVANYYSGSDRRVWIERIPLQRRVR